MSNLPLETDVTKNVEVDVPVTLWSVRDKSDKLVPVDEFYTDQTNDLRVILSVDTLTSQQQEIIDYFALQGCLTLNDVLNKFINKEY